MNNVALHPVLRAEIAEISAEVNRETIAAQQREYRAEIDALHDRLRESDIRAEELQAKLAVVEEDAIARLADALRNMEDLVADCDVPERRMGREKIGSKATLLTLHEAERWARLATELVHIIYGHPTVTALCGDCRKVSCESPNECGGGRG